MWTISSHPNIITLVGYSDNPKCIMTKVTSFFFFLKKKKSLNKTNENY